MDWQRAFERVVTGDIQGAYNKSAEATCGSCENICFIPMELTCQEFFRGNMMEFGCGNGRFSAVVIRDGYADKITAIDVSDICIERTKNTFEKAGVEGTCLRANIESYNTDERFDTIACWETVEHLLHPHLVLNKLSGFLADGGALIGSVPEGRAHDNVLHLHHFYPNDLQDMLMEYFEEVRIRRYYIEGAKTTHLVFVARFPVGVNR